MCGEGGPAPCPATPCLACLTPHTPSHHSLPARSPPPPPLPQPPPQVCLLFAVNNIPSFQAYGVMSSRPGQYRRIQWSGGFFGDSFGVDWRLVHKLPFVAVNHLTNPFNENRPLHMARDGQEVPR